MMKQKNSKYSILIPVLSLVVSCCSGVSAEKREQSAAEAKGDIVVGIVHTSVYANFFLEGVNLAVEEINQQGGLSGRKIKTVIRDDFSDARRGEAVADELSGDKDVIAVIGHGNSNTAIPASVIYEKAGIVFVSYGAKDPDLTLYSGKFTFRNIPTQKDYGREIARFSHELSLSKTLVFHEREADHKSLADIFKKEAVALGAEIVATRSYFHWEKDFKDVIAQLKKDYEFDSVVISGSMPAAALVVKQLREMDITVPILGGDGLDSPDLWVIAGKAADGIIVPTVFNPGYPDKLTRDFVRRFQKKYDLIPDTWAAQGYDALSLIAYAVEDSDSAVPSVISNTLRFLEKWRGVTGSYSFVPEGDIAGKDIYFKKMNNGEFVFAEEDRQYESDLFNYIEEFTLRVPLRESLSSFDPGFVKNAGDIEVCEQLFPALTDLNPKTYTPVPELALEWKKGRTNDTTYIFHMRTDAKWTDGEPVTAHDILWSIQRNLHPDTKSPNAQPLFVLKNAQAIYKGEIQDMSKLGVYVPDDFTVAFSLAHPAPYFPALVSLPAFRPLPGAVIEKYGDKWTELENIQTCGPYKPVLWENGKGLFLKKNPDFYDAAKVQIPEIRYYITPQSSVGLAMYENNELDVMGSSYLRLPSAAVPRIRKGPLKDQYHEDPHFSTYTYAFNTKLPPVDIDAVNEGNGEAATTCTRPPIFGSVGPEEEVGIRFDPFQARKWLAQAGYPEGKDFPEITVLVRKSEFHKKVAQGVQSLLRHHLKISVTLQEEEENAYDLSTTQGEPHHLFRVKVANAYPDADSTMKIFDPADPLYKTGWENKEFSQLIHNARSTSDPVRRAAFYRRAEEILCKEEAVVIPLYFEIYHSLVKPRVKGWSHMAIGGQHIYEWYFEDK